MAEQTITATPYSGALAALDLLSDTQTIVLADFDAAIAGLLVDNDGTLGGSDDGISTFEGAAITYIGSGTVQPGVNVLGTTVPLGAAVPVVVYEAGGQIYFHFPEGPPNLLGAVAMVVDIGPTPYSVFTPTCLTEGTLIETEEGERPVETLAPGDRVRDIDGALHTLRWAGASDLTIPLGLSAWFERWLPVLIPAHSFGPGRPARDLRLSQQHCVLLEGHAVEMMAGQRRALAPARLLTGGGVRIDRDIRQVRYHHLLFDSHVILLADGLPVESLLPGPVFQEAGGGSSWAEACALFPDLQRGDFAGYRAAAVILRRFEAQVIRAAMWPGPAQSARSGARTPSRPASRSSATRAPLPQSAARAA